MTLDLRLFGDYYIIHSLTEKRDACDVRCGVVRPGPDSRAVSSVSRVTKKSTVSFQFSSSTAGGVVFPLSRDAQLSSSNRSSAPVRVGRAPEL